MKASDGRGRLVRELLGGAKYSIDYYQREYRWQPKQALTALTSGQKEDAAALICVANTFWNPARLSQEAQA